MSYEINPAALAGEYQAGEAARLRAELEHLVTSSNSVSFDIGETAFKIKRTGDYGGYTTFQEYGKTLPIKIRKLQYLTRIAEVMDSVGIPRSRYEQLGIAKLRQITSLNPDETWHNKEEERNIPLSEFIVGLVDRGTELSIQDVTKHVKTLKGHVGENDIVVKHFSLTQSALDNIIEPALQLAKMHLGSARKDDEGISQDASDGQALEMIAVEFINDPANGYHNMFEEPLEESQEKEEENGKNEES